MRRLSISMLAGLLMVGLVAAPAAADRDYENGTFPGMGLQEEGDS